MNPSPAHSPVTAPATAPRRLAQRCLAYLPDLVAFAGALLSAVLCALLLGSVGGCGGGVGSEGTGSFASSYGLGQITGFGSIVVNGVHYDETSATVTDDDGQPTPRSALALGMVVAVTGGPVATSADGNTLTATATRVVTQRALVGPASAVDVAAGRLQVLGQVVQVSADTVFASSLAGGLGAVANGALLEVYGFYDASRTAFNATHIALAPVGTAWRVSGPVASIDSAQSFTIGNQSYTGTTTGLSAGTLVRLTLQTLPDDSGRLKVDTQRQDDKAPDERDGAGVEGVVSAVSGNSRFVVNGVTVDSSGAQVRGSVQVGAQVAVRGSLRAGVLVASQVDAKMVGEPRGFELQGTLSQLDTVARRFVLRGTTVSYAGASVRFEGGTAASLVGYTGRLKVRGLLSADRTVLEATLIEFDN